MKNSLYILRNHRSIIVTDIEGYNDRDYKDYDILDKIKWGEDRTFLRSINHFSSEYAVFTPIKGGKYVKVSFTGTTLSVVPEEGNSTENFEKDLKNLLEKHGISKSHALQILASF